MWRYAPNEPDLYKTIIKTAAKISNLQLKQDAMFTDLDRYYQTALAFIDTSGYKNLNMTQVQAAAFKIPGLTLFKDPNDSFRQYHWGISANGSFDRLIRNIKAILANQNIWQTFADNAFEFAEQVYNPKSNLMSFKKQMIRLMK